MIFKNRTAAGQVLAGQLSNYVDRPDVIVLALPRGGVPVAFEVAKALNAPLDVFLVRKLGVPDQEELAMGAIAMGDVRVLNREIVKGLHLSEAAIEMVAMKERHELERREQRYRDDRPEPVVRDRTVILVDDGLATGATMRVAVKALQQQHPAKIVIAVPIAAPEICQALRVEVDTVICAETPQPLRGVGLWYDDFSQTTDEEVCDLLQRTANWQLTANS